MGALAELVVARKNTGGGISATRQWQVVIAALETGDDRDHAPEAVVRHMIEQFHAILSRREGPAAHREDACKGA